MNIIDTHIHLYADEFAADREQLIETAMKAGVSKFLMPNIDSSSIDGMYALEKNHPEVCYSMMGLHPCYVKENYGSELKRVEEELTKRNFIAIGEIGIDLYWDTTFAKEQEEVFLIQCQWAFEKNIPVVIHSRNSFGVIIKLLEKMNNKPKGVFHCFTGNIEEGQRAIELGFKLGVGGVLTFKKSGLDAVVDALPLTEMILETDAPYLAPTPHRGKRNEPAFIVSVASRLAEIKKMSVDEISTITSSNAMSLFNL